MVIDGIQTPGMISYIVTLVFPKDRLGKLKVVGWGDDEGDDFEFLANFRELVWAWPDRSLACVRESSDHAQTTREHYVDNSRS